MKNRVIYFPYIRVPESPWLTQMLLYWDQVSSIVPYDFVREPDLLGPYMRALVAEELVWQVSPGAFIPDVPRFTEAFENYLASLDDIENRRRRFVQGAHTQIHIEKVGPIGERLTDQGLASEGHYPWFDVEQNTARDFMSYLATVLGQIEEIDSVPITNEEGSLRHLLSAGVHSSQLEDQLQRLRLEILEEVLPIPSQALSASDIRRVRDRHGDALHDFRRRVERELVSLAGIPDRQLRERQLNIFFDEAQHRIAEIRSWMDT